MFGSGSADNHANKMPDRRSNSGQSAAVFRYQLGQSGSRGILSWRSLECRRSTIIDTQTLKFKRTIGGFVGVVLNATGTAVNNNHSGPDGVTSHGRWLYAGDGDSTLKVIDLNAPTASAIKQTISTGGTTRVDEMALTTDGKLLLAANNAEDPPFGTLFSANGDAATSHVSIITKITVDPTIIPPGAGLSIEQPAWDPTTKRFYTSIPIIANNPPGCNYGQLGRRDYLRRRHAGDRSTHSRRQLLRRRLQSGHQHRRRSAPCLRTEWCHGWTARQSPAGLHPGQQSEATPPRWSSMPRLKYYANIGGITGSDEVWFNSGDRRYYLGASKMH